MQMAPMRYQFSTWVTRTKPRCFKKRTGEELGFQYKSNKKAWMTGGIYRCWLRNVDKEMRAAGRHILLLLDNASSHNSGDLVLTNVRVKRLPPNTTAFLQPMDAGIIASFKRAYKKKTAQVGVRLAEGP